LVISIIVIVGAGQLLGRPSVHDRAPWFWSDQFNNTLLIIGLLQNHDQQLTRGDPGTRSLSVCYLKGRELLAVESVNHAKDYMAARKFIAERGCPNIDKLRDIRIVLRETP
jgi:3-phenylpropionate/trans-cinnamate dioxygenase ferredoxin reductase component